jgi:hypothetical protein
MSMTISQPPWITPAVLTMAAPQPGPWTLQTLPSEQYSHDIAAIKSKQMMDFAFIIIIYRYNALTQAGAPKVGIAAKIQSTLC